MVNSPEFKAFCSGMADQQTIQNFLDAKKESSTEVPTHWDSVKHLFNKSDLDNSRKDAVKVLKNCIITQVRSELAKETVNAKKIISREKKEIARQAEVEAKEIVDNLNNNMFFSGRQMEKVKQIARQVMFKVALEDDQNDFLP